MKQRWYSNEWQCKGNLKAFTLLQIKPKGDSQQLWQTTQIPLRIRFVNVGLVYTIVTSVSTSLQMLRMQFLKQQSDQEMMENNHDNHSVHHHSRQKMQLIKRRYRHLRVQLVCIQLLGLGWAQMNVQQNRLIHRYMQQAVFYSITAPAAVNSKVICPSHKPTDKDMPILLNGSFFPQLSIE